MKHLAAIILCLMSVFHVNAQSISLFNVDASNFPNIKAKFYAFVATGKQARPSASELTLTENGKPRVITSVTCPLPAAPIAISSVLTVDVSGSMSSGSGGTPNIDLAKAAANAWIQGLPAGLSECAITSFDNSNYLNQDFTTDRSRLLSALTTLSPDGGTNYDAGFLLPLAGSLQISQRGKYKRVIVFLSDGMPNFTPNTAAIIASAHQQNCMIFAVTLGMPCPQVLKDISKQTGGQWFENVTTTPEAENVYRNIMSYATGIVPCELTWTSEPVCNAETTGVLLEWKGQSSTASYKPPSTAIAYLKATPNFVNFGKRIPSTQHDTTIILTAQNADFTVIGISRKYGSANFTVVNATFPMVIPKNSSAMITLRFAPSDSSFIYASFEIETDKCNFSFSANGGFLGKKNPTSSLKIVSPNGGEVYVVGSDAVISWEGIAPTDTVILEYSIDSGTTWTLLTSEGTGLNYTWKNVPKPVSTNCLVRVKQRVNGSTTSTALLTLSGHTNYVNDIAYSPDGSKVVTASRDKTAKIWDANSGLPILTLTGHTAEVMGVAYSPDGTTIATAGADKYIFLWNATTGGIIDTFIGHSNYVHSVTFSQDGSRLASSGYDNTARIWDVKTGDSILTLRGHSYYLYDVDFYPDGSTVVTGSGDASARIWNAYTGEYMQTFLGGLAAVMGVAFSPDGTKLATAKGDNSIIMWNAQNGTRLWSSVLHTNLVNGVAFSPTGSLLATSSYDKTATIWDANTGVPVLTLMGHMAELMGITFSPNGNRVATTSYDKTAKIWEVDGVILQEDVSDAVFAIVSPMASGRDVDMLQCLVQSGRDSIVTRFIENTGLYPFLVDSIAILGKDANQFSLVSGIPPYSLDVGQGRAAEFYFSPTSVGVKTAQIIIFTQADTVRKTIKGEGIPASVSVINNLIDFGQILLGSKKDTIKAVTIRNNRSVPLTITDTRHAGPNDIDFTTLAGGGSFVLAPFDSARLDLEFHPKSEGRVSGRLLFEFNDIGSPATVQLFGEGVPIRTTIAAQDITSKSGEKVNLVLTLKKSSGLQLTGAPTEWQARLHYNSSILFIENIGMVCTGTTDSCALELTGVYDPKTDELISILCITTLGNTDHSTIVIDTFYWKNSSIVTEVATQNGTITLNGVCEDGGVRLFIPAKNSTSLSTRPNPAQDNLQIHYGLREPLTVTLELLTMTGQVAQTILNNQVQAAGQYTLTSDLSILGNGVYLLRLRTNKEMLTTRVDVVK